MAHSYQNIPTVKSNPNFSVAEDAEALRAAMKGFGTDEQAIIDILTSRTNGQRTQIAKYFTEELGRDLIEDLKSELGGKFEDVIVGLCTPPYDYLAKHLHKAMDGLGTEEESLIEILCTRDTEEIQRLVEAYERKYDRPLAEHMCSETTGDFRRFLTLIVTGVRSQDPPDLEKATNHAESLFKSGEDKAGTDEAVFNRILARESFPQLNLIFEQYKEIAGKTIEQALKNEMSGDLLDAMLALVESVQHKPTFYAKRLHKAMSGAGTDDPTLIRIIVSRSEIDLGNIKQEYERIYDKTLESAIRRETSGDYKHALLALIGHP